MVRLSLVTALLTLVLAAPAAAAQLLPPEKKVYTGVTGSKSITQFEQQVGKHASVFGFFTKWNGPVEYIYDAVEQSGSRLALHISTQDGYGTPEAVTPADIANGAGDDGVRRTVDTTAR